MKKVLFILVTAVACSSYSLSAMDQGRESLETALHTLGTSVERLAEIYDGNMLLVEVVGKNRSKIRSNEDAENVPLGGQEKRQKLNPEVQLPNQYQAPQDPLLDALYGDDNNDDLNEALALMNLWKEAACIIL